MQRIGKAWHRLSMRGQHSAAPVNQEPPPEVDDDTPETKEAVFEMFNKKRGSDTLAPGAVNLAAPRNSVTDKHQRIARRQLTRTASENEEAVREGMNIGPRRATLAPPKTLPPSSPGGGGFGPYAFDSTCPSTSDPLPPIHVDESHLYSSTTSSIENQHPVHRGPRSSSPCPNRDSASDELRKGSDDKRRNSVFVKRGSLSMDPVKKVDLDDVYRVYKQRGDSPRGGRRMPNEEDEAALREHEKQELGTGRFGYIKLAEHKQSGQKIAIKFFPRPQTKQVDFVREYNYSYFLSPHPQIIDTYEGMYQASDESAYFFVQELCPSASLREAIERSQNGLGEENTKKVMLGVLSAIEFMHNENLVHRNLKAENILLFDPKDFSKVKVTDFGLTRKVDSAKVKHLEYINVYHAPELCETVVNEVLTVSKSIDLWALGIIFYLCLRGRFPWQNATIMCKQYWEWDQWLKRKIPALPKKFTCFSEKALKLLKKTLNTKPKDRWTVKEVRKCIQKERLMKPAKTDASAYVYYPPTAPRPEKPQAPVTNTTEEGAPDADKDQPRPTSKRSAIHQWINSTLNTMAEISEQVVSAREF